MYEFTKKEVRNKFKATGEGKKINKKLYIGAIVTLVLFIIDLFIVLFGVKLMDLDINTSQKVIDISWFILFISVVFTCYLDGKRDGAIEQFERNLKTKK